MVDRGLNLKRKRIGGRDIVDDRTDAHFIMYYNLHRTRRLNLARFLQRFFRRNWKNLRLNRHLAAMQSYVKSLQRRIEYIPYTGPHRRPSARREAWTWGRNYFPLINPNDIIWRRDIVDSRISQLASNMSSMNM